MDELLEFSFCRLYEALSGKHRAVLDAITIFDHPQDVNALSKAANLNVMDCIDVLEGLKGGHLVSEFQSDLNPGSSVYDSNTLVKRFVYAALGKRPGDETVIRKRLESWYDASDIADPEERRIEQEIRRGKRDSERTFISMGASLRRQGNYHRAQQCFKHALRQNPKSWKAYRETGEVYRQQHQTAAAMQMYEQAKSLVPKRLANRALIFREYGMLLRASGMPDGKERAIAMFETALIDSPNDRVCIVALAQTHAGLGHWNRVKSLLEPLADHDDPETRSRARRLLVEAYEATNDVVKAAQMRPLGEG